MGQLEPASWYDDFYRENIEPGGMTGIHQETIRGLHRHFKIDDASIIMDLGCGPGWFAKELRRSGYTGRYVGVDFSKVAVDQARTWVDKERLATIDYLFDWVDLRKFQIDVSESTKEERAATIVVALEVLEHLEDDVGVLRRIVPVSTQVLLSVPTYDSSSHVRWFKPTDDLAARYGLHNAVQWERDGQLYVAGVMK